MTTSRTTRILATSAGILVAGVCVPGTAMALFGTSAANTGNRVTAATVVAPTITSVTADAHSATISWADPTAQAPGVRYQVFDTTTGSTPIATGLDSSTTSATESGLQPGVRYSYLVEAYLPGTSWSAAASPVTATTADVYSLSVPAVTPVAGTQWTLSVTAQRATSATNPALVTDTAYPTPATLTVTGASPSPGGSPATVGGVTADSKGTATLANPAFTAGVAAIPVTLYRAGATGLTATSGAVTGSVTTAVDSAPVTMTWPGSVTVAKNASTQLGLTIPTDKYGNAFYSAAPATVTLTLQPTAAQWSFTSLAAATSKSTSTSETVPNGSLAWSFNVYEVPTGNGNGTGSASLSAASNYSGLLTPGAESLTTK